MGPSGMLPAFTIPTTIPLSHSSRLPIARPDLKKCLHCARPRVAVSQVLSSQSTMKLEVGQRVRVSEHVIMYHKPGMKNQEVDIHGMEGVIIADASLYDGEEIISATAPYIVKFDENPKFKAHLTEEELQVI